MFQNKTNELLSSIIDCAKELGLPDADVVHATDFLRNNEQGLCFDQIVTQLYEYDIELNTDFYSLVEKAAQKLSLPVEEYSNLKELIREENIIPKPVKIQIATILKGILEREG